MVRFEVVEIAASISRVSFVPFPPPLKVASPSSRLLSTDSDSVLSLSLSMVKLCVPVPRSAPARVILPSAETVRFGLLSSVRLARLMSPSPFAVRMLVEPSPPARFTEPTLLLMLSEPLPAVRSTLAARSTLEALSIVMDVDEFTSPVSEMSSLASDPAEISTWFAVSAPAVTPAALESLSSSESILRLPPLMLMLPAVTEPSAWISRETFTPEVISAREIAPSPLASRVTSLTPLRLKVVTLVLTSRSPPLAVRLAPAKSTLLTF